MNQYRWAARLLVALLLSSAAHAEIIAIGEQMSVAATNVELPARGMTMVAVEAKFGAPQTRHDAVGKPPITRWDYPAFAVFFESNRVLHAVALSR